MTITLSVDNFSYQLGFNAHTKIMELDKKEIVLDHVPQVGTLLDINCLFDEQEINISDDASYFLSTISLPKVHQVIWLAKSYARIILKF